MQLQGSWYADDYAMPVIGIVKCQNTSVKNCSSDAEIEQFLARTPFYFVHQQTDVLRDTWSDGNNASYFPTA